MLDPISDMLARIRNANLAKKPEVVFPYSKIKFAISKLLERENWIKKVELLESVKNLRSISSPKDKFKQIKITLKYNKDKQPFISALNRISRPGQRIYVKKDKIPVVLNGFGMAVISTPQGLMTDKEARQKKIGGEVFFEIW